LSVVTESGGQCPPYESGGACGKRVCYSSQLASNPDTNMIETNPILAQIADIRGRVESLRGYL